MNQEELSACITTEEYRDLSEDTLAEEVLLQTCLECEVRAEWHDRHGLNPEILFLPPTQGYIKVRLGEIVSFTLTAKDALSLYQQLGHEGGVETSRHIFACLETAWTLDIDDVEITISIETAERLRQQLAACLP